MQLPPALQALLQQLPQQRSGHSLAPAEPAGAGNSTLLGSGGPSTLASPPTSGSSRPDALSGLEAAAAAGSQALPLEVQAYLQQQQEQQQQAAAAVAAVAAAAQEQQAALGRAPAGGAGAQGAEGFTGCDATQAWPANSASVAALQSSVYGWGGQPLPVEQQAAAAVTHGTLPQALFSLQLPQRLQLQVLLAQQQLQQQQQQQQAYACGAGFGQPGMPQASACVCYTCLTKQNAVMCWLSGGLCHFLECC